MSRQHQPQTSTRHNVAQMKNSTFRPPTVIQPKAKQKAAAQLPEWKPEGNRGPDILERLHATAQAKLTIGQPNDPYEQEADRVAKDVVQRLHSPIKPHADPGSTINLKPLLQRNADLTGGEASTELESSINRAKGGGQPLDAGLQQSMGSAMGADFSNVNVHTDSTSNQLNQSIQARAFTTGSDVFFRKGEYNPGSKGGQELIAHELTHVVQQGAATSGVQRSSGEVLQRWLKDGKTGNVMSQKVAVKFLTKNGINEDLASSLANHAHTIKNPVRKAELLQIARYLNATSWDPTKWGADLFSSKPDPDKKLTEKIVRNEEIDKYIDPEDQQDILDFLSQNHSISGAISPLYWANDLVSQAGDGFGRITKSNLRPVVTAQSFPSATNHSLNVLYRGSGLTPQTVFDYNGFRAWGTDDDLYFHTMQSQTERRHSAYVSTTNQISIASQFAEKQSFGYVYEIDPSNLFTIKIGAMTLFTNENEYVVPYHIPFSSIVAVRPMFGSSTGQSIPLPHDQNQIQSLEQTLLNLEGEKDVEIFESSLYESSEEINSSIDNSMEEFLKDSTEEWQSLDTDFKESLGSPELLLAATELPFFEVLKTVKATYGKLKKSERSKLKPLHFKLLYYACLKHFNRLTLDVGNGQKRTIELSQDKKDDKDAQKVFFELVTDWWFNYYKPQNESK